ncbi:hypothetical protein TSOC_010420 [Tetrabaena socialis]|uniref:Uncharacterized protein n=1 Tax=Tetrabaena socialis TaxID=47790 RepID=A0A2J7ZTB9_9CHLO|nr:hypothetical protein TSOC_010420 [Tetrabaena socialis]|eukprot:PNH03516.1 hypothetical protein TSOC_010420 [Tetrabaena socialis]
MAAKDPNSPAMLEKQLRDPDRPHPREVPLVLPSRGGARVSGVPLKEDPTGHGAPTPAQAEYGERNPELYGRLGVHAVMPDANLASTVASDMPVLTNPGGAFETAGKGETVVADPHTADTKLYAPPVDQLAERLGRAELAPPGTTVVRGSRDKVVESEYGRDEDVDTAPDQFTRKLVDYEEEKVGMLTRPLEARDFYATCDSANEPYSSVKAQNERGDVTPCDVCECAPCQCDKVARDFPFEMTPQEQKRSGRPHLHNARKPVTGVKSHPAHDFKIHSRVRDETHALVDFRTREFEGNVHLEGRGSFEELPPEQREKLAKMVVGGREIDPEMLKDHNRAVDTARHFLG